MTQKEINVILEKHKKWLIDEEGGEQANLTKADLSWANLSGANLSWADLSWANLSWANLSGANLSWANLSGADLSGADLTKADLPGADLTKADLPGADLSGADLSGADLPGADLSGAKLTNVRVNEYTSFFSLQCPESGSYIAYKKAHGYIVKLEIPEDAKRSSATSRKCRASKAKVLSITSVDESIAIESVCSNHNSDFVYRVGEIVEVPDFDENRWKECTPGIHHFITRQEAVNYGN